MSTPRYVDTHCHLGLMSNADTVAKQLKDLGLCVFDCGVGPREFNAAAVRAKIYASAVAGVGLHPWWLADGRCGAAEIDLLCERALSSRFIGEVGLDFSPRFIDSKDIQTMAFRRLCATLATHPRAGRVLSIHAVRSASMALDMLDKSGLLRGNVNSPAIIFHWFSGTSDELTRARNAGCHFSVNEMMLKTKRGREYARQIPLDRLLLETDAPPHLGESYSAQALIDQLERTLDSLAYIRGMEKAALSAAVAENGAELFIADDKLKS